MLGDAKDEIKKSDDIWDSPDIKALREQQEEAFGFWGPHKFTMPKEEGNWESVTTNSPKVLGNKITGLLSSATLQLYIDTDDETRAKREKIAMTERFANGCIYLADRARTSKPSGKRLQSSLSWYAAIMGGTVKGVLLTEDDDGLHVNIPDYDPEYCQWIEDAEGIAWFCYRQNVTQAYFDSTYKKQIKDGLTSKADTKGRIQTYVIWDRDEWKVACNGEWIKDSGEVHGLGRVPINVRTVGDAPSKQSENHTDVLKYSWMNVYFNNPEIYDLQSRLLSIGSSIAKESGKVKVFGQWDSSVTGSNITEELEKAGYSASNKRTQVLLFDKAKGEDFKGFIPPPTMDAIERFFAKVTSMDIIGSIDPIAFGQMSHIGSGALAAELRSAALEFINPFRNCVQDDFVWAAEECARQFKQGNFGKASISGRDARNNRFNLEIDPKDIDDKQFFECKLVPERLRDEIQELGAAVQEQQFGLLSKEESRLKHNLSPDPDRTQDKMDGELAKNDGVYRFTMQAKYWLDQGDKEMADYYLARRNGLIRLTIAKEAAQIAQLSQPAAPSAAGLPGMPLTPQAQVGQMQGEPMADMESFGGI